MWVLNKDSLDSELPSERRGEALPQIGAHSQKRARIQGGYTKHEMIEKRSPRLDPDTQPTTRTNPTISSSRMSESTRQKQSSRYESAELSPQVQMAQRAMAVVQGDQTHGAKRKYFGDGKPRPRNNEMVSSFIIEFGSVLDDQNKNGSITGTLRTAQAAGLERDVDILMCLVRAYAIARDTRKVKKSRMALFNKMFGVFTEAWATGTFHYTEEDLITDIDKDERLRNWVVERGFQPKVPDQPSAAHREELVEATIMPDGDRVVTSADEVAEVESLSSPGKEGNEHVRTSGMLLTRRVRTAGEKETRKDYAQQVRRALRDAGVPGMLEATVDHEHFCGCPLFWDIQEVNWKCAHCRPNYQWNGEVREQIASILEH